MIPGIHCSVIFFIHTFVPIYDPRGRFIDFRGFILLFISFLFLFLGFHRSMNYILVFVSWCFIDLRRCAQIKWVSLILKVLFCCS
ncbi:hypothetical protein ACS0TY_015632 [Phlomoides rotata]